MAELVLGVGSSHSPMVSLGGDDWLEWGRGDLKHPMLYTRDGRHLSYDEQLALAGDSKAGLATMDRCLAGADRVQAAVSRLQSVLVEAKLDTIVIIGDDQDEHLLADNLPPFLIYWGDTITNGSVSDRADAPPVVQRFLPGYREVGAARDYPVNTTLAQHLISSALDGDFDVAASAELPKPDLGMGHAFGFPMRRLAPEGVSIVPVMLNTYNPPSQPRASRCRAFGAMLRTAIESFPGDERVGVIASGGLSHFVVQEELDREVLKAFEQDDLDSLVSIPEPTFSAGTSEIKNWITTGSMCEGFDFEVVDYVPGYRTPAGTGTGLAFAIWR